MIKLECLGVTLEGKNILHDINLDLQSEMLHVICGTNGSGKTTLLRALCGLIANVTGKIFINDQDCTFIPAHKRMRTLGWVPAHQSVLFHYTGRDVLGWSQDNTSTKMSTQFSEPMQAAIKRMDIEPLLDLPINKLSLGEQKRIHLARVIGSNTAILLLDEPTSGLDPATAMGLMAWLKNSPKNSGQTIIASLHDITLAKRFSDSVTLLANGTVTDHGSSEEVFLGQPFEQAVKIKWDETILGFRPL